MNFKKLIAEAISQKAGLTADDITEMLETPPDPDLGDFAFPCFKLAKTMRKAPQAIAKELSEIIALPEGVSSVSQAGGYLNFALDRTAQARSVVEQIREEGPRYGGSEEGGGRNVCIDYSSVNICKPLHIGHLSSTVIGNSLYRIYNHLGYRSVGINHLGDWGTQFGKMIVAFKKWGSRDAVEQGGVDELCGLYIRFHKEAEKDDELNSEARAWFRKIELNDPEAVQLFDWFKETTLKEVFEVYDLMGIRFDSYAGESFYNDKMDRVINELKEKHLLKEDNGAQIVDLSAYNMPPCLILRSDGATLYATRDIAAALYRKDTYDFAKCLYVVAYQQDLHFRQWFKVIELMGYEWARDLIHVNFGMVSGAQGAFRTREGNMVKLRDVLQASIEKTHEIMLEKTPDLENSEEIAKQVGIGAVIWGTLYSQRIKDIVFSWDSVLNFDGETGPYVQYTHARACSVLRKQRSSGEIDYSLLSDTESRELVSALGAFPDAVHEAMVKNEPYLVSRAVMAICQAFNRFYYQQRIIADDPAVRNARLALTEATESVLKTGLYLVGLEAPERM